MNVAKRSHTNPCFWTALWSPHYYEALMTDQTLPGEARSQVVFALNAKTGRIRRSSVEKVHYDKDLAVAEITREAADDFARRYHPDKYPDLAAEIAAAHYPIYLDFESFLTGIEQLRPYQVLIEVARTNSIGSVVNKTELATFVVLQQLRSHSILNARIEWEEKLQHHKFEALITLRWSLENSMTLYRMVLPLLEGRWTLFATDSDAFPLCDSPVLVQRRSIMVALSPRMLLEIQPPIHEPIDKMPRVRTRMKSSKLDEFRRRTIGNTFRDIIFGDQATLESWQESGEFQERVRLLKDNRNYNRLVATEDDRELWLINAYGNLE